MNVCMEMLFYTRSEAPLGGSTQNIDSLHWFSWSLQHSEEVKGQIVHFTVKAYMLALLPGADTFHQLSYKLWANWSLGASLLPQSWAKTAHNKIAMYFLLGKRAVPGLHG